MNTVVYTIILLAVILNTAAQIVMKIGIGKIGAFAFTLANFIPVVLKIIASPWIILGIIIYTISCGMWLMVLSRAPVSIAYPLSSLGYVTSAIASYYLLNENLSVVRIAGIIVILVGVYMVARS